MWVLIAGTLCISSVQVLFRKLVYKSKNLKNRNLLSKTVDNVATDIGIGGKSDGKAGVKVSFFTSLHTANIYGMVIGNFIGNPLST